MKKFFGFNKLLASVAVLAAVMIFQSCLDDDDNDYYRYAWPNALVTVKPVADNSFFMQLDDSTTLDRKSTRLNSSHPSRSRMPSSA